MVEAFVRLLCPECTKEWESSPSDLPDSDQNLSCPDCHATRRLAQFMRTDRDLEVVQQFE